MSNRTLSDCFIAFANAERIVRFPTCLEPKEMFQIGPSDPAKHCLRLVRIRIAGSRPSARLENDFRFQERKVIVNEPISGAPVEVLRVRARVLHLLR